jgi:hypothetical protein
MAKSINVFLVHMLHMHIQLYFQINPITHLEIDKAMTNGSAVYILLGEIFIIIILPELT